MIYFRPGWNPEFVTLHGHYFRRKIGDSLIATRLWMGLEVFLSGLGVDWTPAPVNRREVILSIVWLCMTVWIGYGLWWQLTGP